MSHDFSKEFFAEYHATVFQALGGKAQEYNVKIGSMLASRWMKKLKDLPEGSEGFKKAFETYFNGPFRFAEIADITFNVDGSASMYVNGCDICPGNEILRGMDMKGCCPISHMVKSAMGRSLKKKVELLGVEKPGPVGECYLKYRLT